MIPGHQYWIGTGVYIDDVQQKKKEILAATHSLTTDFLKKLQLFLGLVLFLIVCPLTLLLVRGIVNPVCELTKVANKFSLGNLDLEFPAKERKDEIGKLAFSIERLGFSIRLAMERLNNKIANKPKPFSGDMSEIPDTKAPFSPSIPITKASPDLMLNILAKDMSPSDMAKLTILLFDHWRLHWRDQLILLGLKNSGPEQLARISLGKDLPDSPDFTERLELFLKIYEAMRLNISGKPILISTWIKESNVFFNDQTPLEVIEKEGSQGLAKIAEIISKVVLRTRQVM